MIASLTGVLEAVAEDFAVVDVSGVGYLVFSSGRTLANLPQPGEPVRISAIDIRLLGEAARDEEFASLRQDPGFAVGDPLHHGHFDAFRGRLLTLAQRRGYFDADVSQSQARVDAAAGTATIEVELASGRRYRFGELRYDSGLVDADTLRALRSFERGAPYLQARLREFQARIQGTGCASGAHFGFIKI